MFRKVYPTTMDGRSEWNTSTYQEHMRIENDIFKTLNLMETHIVTLEVVTLAKSTESDTVRNELKVAHGKFLKLR